MTEAEALALLNASFTLAAQIAALAPQLVANWQNIKEGLASNDAAALNAQIIATHEQVQAMDAQLQALRS